MIFDAPQSNQNLDGLTDFLSGAWTSFTDNILPNVVSITGQVLTYKTAQETAAAQQAVAAAQQAAINAANARAAQQVQQNQQVQQGQIIQQSVLPTYLIIGGIGLLAILLIARK